ncbi:XRE family transcriptional regulator [Vibrio parahaemolyticus]|nr:XRE family transcriptional regulator [Vibrio parahaemolyticus]MDF5202080.1 XRE family transcriptional regulator [Vibrio parahaemolyticus]
MSNTYTEKTIEQKNDSERFFLSDIKSRFSQKLEEAMNGETNLSFAQKCGISEATIRKYKKGDTTPNLENLEAIAKASGKDILWFIHEQDKQEPAQETVPVEFQRIINAPRYNVAASAGGGSFIDTENPVDRYSFSYNFLKKYKLLHANLCVIDTTGDSMEPTITEGAEIMVDLFTDTTPNALAGVYVINLDGELRVKRLEYSVIKDGYRIISDNHLYPEEFIERANLDRMRVIGEVVMVIGKPASQPAKD